MRCRVTLCSFANPLVEATPNKRSATRGQGRLRSFCLTRARRPAAGGASPRTFGNRKGRLPREANALGAS